MRRTLNSPEGFCFTFRIPEGNSKLAQAEKKLKERNRRKWVSTAQAKKEEKRKKETEKKKVSTT